MTYQEGLAAVREHLQEAGIADAASDAWIIFEYVTGITRTGFYMEPKAQLAGEQEARLLELAAKRAEHIPVQHLTGEQDFFGLTFTVNEHVLVPRQDTELLVEKALAFIRAKGERVNVLDLCTGSGCIGISIAVNANADVTLADISPEALSVARANAKRNRALVTFAEGDLFEAADGTYDIIVSNPPYIPTKEIEMLAEEVKDHDPWIALDGLEDGLHFYRRIIGEASSHLTKGGALMFEIGYDQSADVEGLMRAAGFENVCTSRDLAGLDRVVCGVYY